MKWFSYVWNENPVNSNPRWDWGSSSKTRERSIQNAKPVAKIIKGKNPKWPTVIAIYAKNWEDSQKIIEPVKYSTEKGIKLDKEHQKRDKMNPAELRIQKLSEAGKLIGSGPTLDKLKDAIAKYFYSPDIELKEVSDGVWEVHNSKGKIEGFRVVKKGKRFRFEHIGD